MPQILPLQHYRFVNCINRLKRISELKKGNIASKHMIFLMTKKTTNY